MQTPVYITQGYYILFVYKMLRTNKYLLLLVLVCFIHKAHSQINSPFSRYGIGVDHASQNPRYLGIGGMSAAFSDQQALNTSNPASYGDLHTIGPAGGLATFDLGFDISSHNLKSLDPVGTYKSNNFRPSYFSMGLPIAKSGLGLVFGLKSLTDINYNIKEQDALPINGYPDSVRNYNTLYNGSGGLNQVFLGLGKRIGHLSVGVNLGYDFGKRSTSTQTAFDSSAALDPTEAATQGSIYNVRKALGGFVWEGGVQYEIPLSTKTDPETKIKTTSSLTIGATLSTSQKLTSKTNTTFFKYYASDPDNPIGQDTVQSTGEIKGKVTLPSSYKVGLMYNNYMENIDRWGVGAEYNSTSWTGYKEDGVAEQAYADSYMIRGGVYFRPNPLRGKSMFSRARYSAGFYTGKDKLVFDGKQYKIQAVTLGMDFMLRNYVRTSRQYSQINTALEFGRRGSDENNVSESFIKFSIGFSLSDFWFTKRRY